MLFVTTPARFFECAVIADLVLHAPSDGPMTVKTFSIGKLPGVIMAFCAVVGNVVSLMSFGKFIRCDHDIKFFGDRNLLGQEIALRSQAAYEEGGH